MFNIDINIFNIIYNVVDNFNIIIMLI